jgi:hypothetical protein
MNFSRSIFLPGVNYSVKIRYTHSLYFMTLCEMLIYVIKRLRKTSWKIRQYMCRFLPLKRVTATACGHSYCGLFSFWACELISRVVWRWRVVKWDYRVDDCFQRKIWKVELFPLLKGSGILPLCVSASTTLKCIIFLYNDCQHHTHRAQSDRMNFKACLKLCYQLQTTPHFRSRQNARSVGTLFI